MAWSRLLSASLSVTILDRLRLKTQRFLGCQNRNRNPPTRRQVLRTELTIGGFLRLAQGQPMAALHSPLPTSNFPAGYLGATVVVLLAIILLVSSAWLARSNLVGVLESDR